MNQPHGSTTVAKRSLKHFAIGRVASAVVGITTLLVLVRVLDRADYGLYIALMAGFEIAQLAASPGAYAVVFRYVPELRGAAGAAQLRQLVRWLMAYRVLTLGLAAAALAFWANEVAAFLGASAQGAAVRIYALVLLFEALCRLIDVQFESLLEQGLAQFSVLCRNGAKLLALLVLSNGTTESIALGAWVVAEAVTSAMGVVVSVGLTWRYLNHQPQGEGRAVDLSLARLRRFALPTYVSQVIYMSTSTEMVKILVSKFAGAVVAAPFGFAAALATTMQRYLPSFLLVGWLRPLFITAREQGKSGQEIVGIAGAVIKLNALFLAPMLSAILVAGPDLVNVLAGGRLPDSLPFLYFFAALLLLQSVRGVVSMLGFTFELGSASLRATLLSVLGLLMGLAGYPWLGVWSLSLGVAISELLWIMSMAWSLRTASVLFTLPWTGMAKLALSAGAAATAVGLARSMLGVDSAPLSIAFGIVAAVFCLGISALLRPFETSERALINRLLPARLFIW